MKTESKQNNDAQHVCCEPELYDDISIVPNSEGGGYEAILKQIKSKYDVAVINSGTIPDSKNKTPLLIRMPDKKEGIFKLYIKKGFIVKNEKDFLELLKELISKKDIRFIKGSISYDANCAHFFINLQTFPCTKDAPIMYRICHTYGDVKCLFKHKDETSITMFCKITSNIYPFKGRYEIWNYSLDYFKEDGRSSALTDFLFLINEYGNVKIEFGGEKLNILAREIYARNLSEGLELLKKEMGNLGFDVKIAEKKKVRDFK